MNLVWLLKRQYGSKKENRVQRGLNFAILDEVDSILIDEARTPLIISGGHMESKTYTIVLTYL